MDSPSLPKAMSVTAPKWFDSTLHSSERERREMREVREVREVRDVRNMRGSKGR
jgi:hypothetical protein